VRAHGGSLGDGAIGDHGGRDVKPRLQLPNVPWQRQLDERLLDCESVALGTLGARVVADVLDAEQQGVRC
jgi:hypothetical protein